MDTNNWKAHELATVLNWQIVQKWRWVMAVKLQKAPVVKECIGCDNIDGDVCRIWATPAAKWRLGVCASATHVKAEVKTEAAKVRVGQQKQKKK